MKVFVDTNIFKYSASELRRFRPSKQDIDWAGKKHVVEVYEEIIVNPNDNITNNARLRSEVDLIPEIVHLQNSESIQFCITSELDVETMGIPSMDSLSGRLYGAEIIWVDPPIKYARVVSGWCLDAKEDQYEFIRSLKSPRFEQIQKAVGAYQGVNPPNRNQLLDAFHLWCAEHACCDFFLTAEAEKLNRMMSQKKNFSYEPSIVSPSELLSVLDGGFPKKQYRYLKRRFASIVKKIPCI